MLLESTELILNKKAPTFELKNPSGKVYTLDEVMGDKGLVIAFICNHCPYVKAVIERFVVDAKELKDIGVNTVAIMPNDYSVYAEDSPENMIKFANKHAFGFPYLVDETQEVAKAYDAVCTPDFFGLNSKGEFQYRGRIDDARLGDAERRNPELLNAMAKIAKEGIGPKDQNPSMGCSIKWK